MISRGDEKHLVDPKIRGFEVVQAHDFIEVGLIILHDFS